MSKLDELIQTLCPNGVEYVYLGNCSRIKRGNRVTKSELIEGGKYPVFSGGVTPMGYLNSYNRNENTITVVQYGTAGFVNFITEKFWANDVCYSVFPNENLNNKDNKKKNIQYISDANGEMIAYTIVLRSFFIFPPNSLLIASRIVFPANLW